MFQNEQHFYYLCKSYKDNNAVVELFKGTHNEPELIERMKLNTTEEALELKVEADNDKYSFYYKTGDDWELLADDLDGKYLSTKIAGGFVGVVFGLYTTSNGQKSTNSVKYDWFSYYGGMKFTNSRVFCL